MNPLVSGELEDMGFRKAWIGCLSGISRYKRILYARLCIPLRRLEPSVHRRSHLKDDHSAVKLPANPLEVTRVAARDDL